MTTPRGPWSLLPSDTMLHQRPDGSVAITDSLKRELHQRTERESLVTRSALQPLATAFFALFSIVGLGLWGLPFYYDFMVQQFGWTRAQVTSGNAVSKLIVGPAVGFIAGWMVDRLGPRRLMIVGILLAGAALIGLGSISTLPLFYFFYLLNALGYVGGGPLPNQVLLSRTFDKSRGKAMGIAYLGIGLGGAVVPWISHTLVQHFGWQASLRSVGVLIILIAFPWAFFVKEPSVARIQTIDKLTSVKGALTKLPFYLLALGSMCSIAAVSGTQQNLKLFLSLDLRYAQSESAQILSLVLAFSIVGRLLMGWLADRFAKKYVMLLIYALVAIAIPLLFLAQTRAAVAIFSVIFGMGLGGDYMIIPLMTAEIFDLRIMGRLMGLILTADGVAEATSPMLIGYLRDRTGSYRVGFLVLIGMALLGAIAVTALPRRRETS